MSKELGFKGVTLKQNGHPLGKRDFHLKML